MKYVGLYTQQRKNNAKSVLLLLLFPTIILVLVFAFFALAFGKNSDYRYDEYTQSFVSCAYTESIGFESAVEMTLDVLPWVVGIVSIWFVIAYFSNTSMIRHAVGAHSLARMEDPRVYNIVENLCIACGMNMPKINVIDTPELNAFASGIDEKSYTVTVTTGICQKLNDDELAGVIGHELTHIRNNDTRLLIVSIIFVGIMSTIMSLAFRMAYHAMVWGGERRSNKKNSGGGAILLLLLVAVLAGLGYIFTLLTRFAISRKREYMADAGGAELCGNPLALASALRKISSEPAEAPEGRDDIAQLFIIHPHAFAGGINGWFRNLFSTHPSTQSRIAYLEQF